MQNFTLKPNYTSNDKGFFGTVDIVIGTKIVNSRVIRKCRQDKHQALEDSAKLARSMIVFGVNTPINLSDYR